MDCWQTDQTRKRQLVATHMPIEQHIRIARKEVEAQEGELPPIRAKINELRRRIELEAHDGCRRHIRLKKDLMRIIVDFEAKVARVETKQHLVEFDEQVAPFLEAYYRQVNRSERPKNPKHMLLPGEHHTRLSELESDTPQADIVSEFLTIVEKKQPNIKTVRKDDCPRCGKEMRMVPARAVLSCTSCGYTASYLDATTSSTSYGEDVEFTSFSYKRINVHTQARIEPLTHTHTTRALRLIIRSPPPLPSLQWHYGTVDQHFNEWLSNFQAKETLEIGEDVLEMVMTELQRQRFTDPATITPKKVREVLKHLRLRKTYEHTAQICERITGIPAPKLSASTEEMCRLMFKATQPSFERHCPPERKNFLSYSYCLYKFLQQLGHDSLLENFTLLKGRDKLLKQDEIFMKICEDLDWTFYPST